MTVPGHASHGLDSNASLLDALREHPEFQVGAAYLGSAWLIYDVTDLVVFAFELPDVVLRIVLGLLGAGAILTLLLGRWLQLTLLELRRGRPAPDEDIRGVPDFLEAPLIRATRAVNRRTALLATAGSAVVFFFLFFFLWSSWAAAHDRPVDDPRITLLVYPFGESSPGVEELGSGLADLLSVTLDGTPGLRVVDPSSVWESLARDEDGAPTPPEEERARDLSRDAGASRFVTGDLLRTGSRLEISARVHRVEPAEARAPLRISAHEDSLSSALERLAVQVVAAVWKRDQLPTVPAIDRSATESAEALKAYLEAKGALRHGRVEAAREAVERAVALDSTFALAHLERFLIEGQILFARGRPMTGLRPIMERAARHAERLTPRNRMRIDAHRALDATDGRRAAFLFERILAIDSLDVDALEGLAFTYLIYGWQLDRDPDDVEGAYRRVVRADSTNTEALATLTRLAWWRGDPGGAGAWARRLEREDSLGAQARGTRAVHEILTAPESVVDSLLRRWAGEDVGVVTTVLRDLRTVRPGLAERFFRELAADSMPTYHRRMAQGGRAQLWFARGRLAGVDSLLEAGELDNLRTALAGYHVAAALAGVGDRAAAARSAEALAARSPIDSLEAHLDTREAWRTGWAVGAIHAAFGDTARARRWRDALGGLPPGETTVPEWPSALTADLEARMAARRGDLEAAERWARRAYERWAVHAFTYLEHHPEPAIRFHLAQVLRERGRLERARALYRSLCPPHTWMGFYTARSWLELGKLQEAAGETAEAARNYRAAVRMWDAGDEAVVGRRLEEARAGLARTGA